jgi:hypothetical protein
VAEAVAILEWCDVPPSSLFLCTPSPSSHMRQIDALQSRTEAEIAELRRTTQVRLPCGRVRVCVCVCLCVCVCV